ncbi:MAG: hypothetical protein ACE5R7_00125 [Nitrosarchaeum sp.]
MTDHPMEKSKTSMYSILDDVTIIGLSVEVFEKHYQKYMDDDAKQYLIKIKKHCDNIVKTVNENNNIV